MPPTMTVDPAKLGAAFLAFANGEKDFEGYKNDAPGSAPSVGLLHGPGGLLTFPGVDPDVFQTIVGVRPGILADMPTRGSIYANGLYEIITGVGAHTGDPKSAPCDVAPVGGVFAAGKVAVPFGRYEYATREIELGRVGKFNDRADPRDLRMMGNPISTAIFGVDQMAPGNVLVSEMQAVMYQRAVFANRDLSQQVWQGDPANNTAGGGYREFPGLDLLVTTGYVDAETGLALPAVDSTVDSFGYQAVQDAGPDLVSAITTMYRNAKLLAETTGVAPVRFQFAMREALFYEITKVWPCSYYLGGCTVTDASGQRVVIDARDQIDLRDQMRTGRYLLIDGERVEVRLDDGIVELDGNSSGGNFPAGCFSSSIYLLSMSVLGGTSSLYLEYFDFENDQTREILNSQIGGPVLVNTRTNGAWLDTISHTRWCLQWQAMIQPRVVLRTPWLCAKLQHVVYCPVQQARQPFPSDPYFVNGGETSRPGPSFYAPWQS